MWQPIDYSFSNQTLYPTAFMQKRAYKMFVTVPHTDLTPTETVDAFKTYSQVVYIKAAQEHHEDGDTHIHIYVAFKQQVKYSQVMKILGNALGNRIPRGTVNIDVPKSSEAVCKYIDKEGNTVEFGERPNKVGKQESRSEGYSDAIQKAKTGNMAEAMEILFEHQPRDMLIHGDAITDNLNKLNNVRKKYDIPIPTKDNTTLKTWQKQLFDIVSEAPKKRRIIWVVGQPGSGKTFMHDYLTNLENYEYGLYDAGQCVSFDNVVYGYDEEGIVCWDFPMNYDWDAYSTAAANLIEKFSDFGTRLSSKKYKGNTKFVRGHCLVFSNRQPLESLSHRDVVVIDIDKIQDKIAAPKEYMDKIEISSRKSFQDKIDKIDSINGHRYIREIETHILQSPPYVKIDIFNPELKRKEKIEKLLIGIGKRIQFLEENNIGGTEIDCLRIRQQDLTSRLQSDTSEDLKT